METRTEKPNQHKFVPNTGNLYSISREGALYRHSYIAKDGRLIKGKFVKPTVKPNGYLHAMLRVDGRNFRKYVHRLVAECWIDNPGNLPIVNHKDEDKQNNSVDNLEWCTSQYNIEYSLPERTIVDPDGNYVKVKSVQRLARENGLEGTSVCAVLNGKLNHTAYWTSPDYYESLPEIELVNGEGKVVSGRFNAVVAKKIGERASTVACLVAGRQKTAKGWRLNKGV